MCDPQLALQNYRSGYQMARLLSKNFQAPDQHFKSLGKLLGITGF